MSDGGASYEDIYHNKEPFISIGREFSRAFIGYQLGLSRATMVKQIPDDSEVGELWTFLAHLAWKSVNEK